MPSLELEIQQAEDFADLPSEEDLSNWAEAALLEKQNEVEHLPYKQVGVVLRFVGEEEGQELNRDYRGKDYATNVLSFEFDWPAELEKPDDEPDYLGDLVICVPVVEKEAQEQKKEFRQHLAHLVVHGMLHLQGFDHLTDAEAEEMESLEISIMQGLGFANPYLEEVSS